MIDADIVFELDSVTSGVEDTGVAVDESSVVVLSSSLDVRVESSEPSDVLDLDCLEDVVVIVAVTGAFNVTAEALVVAAATVVDPALVPPRTLFTALSMLSRKFCLRPWVCIGAAF